MITPPPPCPKTRCDRGIVLLNALVMVAALAAVATALLYKAETARQRQVFQQATGQTGLYLDAADGLAVQMLTEDLLKAPESDQTNEPWALPRLAKIDRGSVAIQITDLQGRFNVNWLADPSDLVARQAFDRLLAGLGLSPSLGSAIAAYVTPRGPVDDTAYARRDVPVRVPGAPIPLIEELALVQGLTPETFTRLRPYVAALPQETRLNVGTALPEVLHAFLPAASTAGLEALLAGRVQKPYASVADFRTRSEALLGRNIFDRIDSARFGLTSRWFSVTLEATLDGRHRRRRLVIARNPAEGLATIVARLEDQE